MTSTRQPDKVVEASDLGWPPGHWPRICDLGEMVNTDIGEVHTNGAKITFMEVFYVDYINHSTEILTRVLND